MKFAALIATGLTLASCNPEIVQVRGQGKAQAEPQFAAVAATVEGHGATSEAAAINASARVRKIAEGLTKEGLAAKDILAQKFNIDHDFDCGKNACEYEATYEISIAIRELSKLGAILALLPRLGVDRMSSPEFRLDDNGKLVKSARATAIANASDKAAEFASAAGRKLGRVVKIDDEQSSVSTVGITRVEDLTNNLPQVFAGQKDAKAMPEVAITKKMAEADVSVYVTYSLE